MTDEAASGSVTQDAASAGTPDAQQTPEVNGSPNGAESPFSGLPEGTRSWVEKKGYKSFADVAETAMHAESKMGSAVFIPAPDAPKEEWDKFHAKLGRPETPDKYEFKRPESLPEDFAYSDEFANNAKAWMHDEGLSPRQAQSLHDKLIGFTAEQEQAAAKANADALKAKLTDTHSALTQEWGAEGSPTFKEKLEMANRGMKNLGLEAAFKETGVLLPDGSLTNPAIAKALAQVGEVMFREDRLGDEQRSMGGGNPFKKDAQGDRDVQAMSWLSKNDPSKARRLAREAGENPADWGL